MITADYKKLYQVLIAGATPLLLIGAATGFWVPLNAYRIYILKPVERKVYPEEYTNDTPEEKESTEAH